MITLSNIGKFYGEQTLFTKVSLQLNAGERYGLVGANGSGKTTLLNMLSGDIEPSEARLRFRSACAWGSCNRISFSTRTSQFSMSR